MFLRAVVITWQQIYLFQHLSLTCKRLVFDEFELPIYISCGKLSLSAHVETWKYMTLWAGSRPSHISLHTQWLPLFLFLLFLFHDLPPQLLSQHEDAIAPDPDDPMRDILRDLGPSPSVESLLGTCTYRLVGRDQVYVASFYIILLYELRSFCEWTYVCEGLCQW